MVNNTFKKDEDKITAVPREFDGTLPKELEGMEIDWEAVEKDRDLRENYTVPSFIKKRVKKYNQWVDDYRAKVEEYKAPKPNYGKKTPFHKGR